MKLVNGAPWLKLDRSFKHYKYHSSNAILNSTTDAKTDISTNTDTYSSLGTINAFPLSAWVHSTPTQGRFPIWLLIPELKRTLSYTQ